MSQTPGDQPASPSPLPAPAAHAHVHTHAKDEPHSVTYCGHTKIIFLWPIIAMGYLFWPLQTWNLLSKETLGWIYFLVMATVLLAVTVDLSRNFGLVWLLLIAFIVTLGRWLADAKQIRVLSDMYGWFRGLDVEYSRGFGLAFSVLLSIVFLVGLIWAWANNRYTMTHNEVIHHIWGRGDRSVGRGARVITMLYPDWFEFLICMAGTIIVYDNTGRTQICKSEHVPLLPLRASKIQKILESLEVTHDDDMTAAAAPTDPDATDDLH